MNIPFDQADKASEPLTMEKLKKLRKVLADSDAIMPYWKGLILIDDGSEEYKNLVKELTEEK